MNLRFLTTITVLCLTTHSALIQAQDDDRISDEQAKIPYTAMYWMIHAIKVEQQSTNLTYKVRISSSLANVAPADISLYIDSKSGAVPIKLDDKGGIVNFPETEELMKENPMIVVNQPRGSIISTQEIVTTRKSKHDGHIPYVDLMRSVHTAVQELRVAETMSKNKAPEILGMGLSLTDPEGKQIVIHSKGGDLVIKPDQDGVCAIPYTQELYKENPQITLPKTPMKSVGFGIIDEEKKENRQQHFGVFRLLRTENSRWAFGINMKNF